MVDLPDDINVSAIFYGPVLLAANMGEVGQSDIGFSWPQEEIKDPAPDAYFPSLMGSRKALESWIIKKEGTLNFTTTGIRARGKNVMSFLTFLYPGQNSVGNQLTFFLQIYAISNFPIYIRTFTGGIACR